MPTTRSATLGFPAATECEKRGGGWRGAVRAVACAQSTISPPDAIYLVAIYAKNEKENLGEAEKKPSRKPSGRSSGESTKLGKVLADAAKDIVRHMKGEIELPMKSVRMVPEVDVRAIREGQGLTREQFAEHYGLQVRAIQEWEQGRRKPEPAVRAYMLVIKNQPSAVRKALKAA